MTWFVTKIKLQKPPVYVRYHKVHAITVIFDSKYSINTFDRRCVIPLKFIYDCNLFDSIMTIPSAGFRRSHDRFCIPRPYGSFWYRWFPHPIYRSSNSDFSYGSDWHYPLRGHYYTIATLVASGSVVRSRFRAPSQRPTPRCRWHIYQI